MDQFFRKIVENNFSDFKGTTAEASIPIPQSLINELVEVTLRGNKTIQSCQVAVHPQNRVAASVKTTLLPWALNLRLKLDTSVDFASYSSPKLRAWMENNRLLGTLGSMLNALPEGIRLYGDQLVFDLGVFVFTPELKRMLDLVKSVEISTEEGRIILDVKAEID